MFKQDIARPNARKPVDHGRDRFLARRTEQEFRDANAGRRQRGDDLDFQRRQRRPITEQLATAHDDHGLGGTQGKIIAATGQPERTPGFRQAILPIARKIRLGHACKQVEKLPQRGDIRRGVRIRLHQRREQRLAAPEVCVGIIALTKTGPQRGTRTGVETIAPQVIARRFRRGQRSRRRNESLPDMPDDQK